MTWKTLSIIFFWLLIEGILSMQNFTNHTGEPDRIFQSFSKRTKFTFGRALGSVFGFMGYGKVVEDETCSNYKGSNLGESYATITPLNVPLGFQYSERNKESKSGLRMMIFFVEQNENFELIIEQPRPFFIYKRLNSKERKLGTMSRVLALSDLYMMNTLIYLVFDPRKFGSYLLRKARSDGIHLPPMVQRFDIELDAGTKSQYSIPHIGNMRMHLLAKMVAAGYYNTTYFPAPTALWSNDPSLPIDPAAYKLDQTFNDNARQLRYRIFKEFELIAEHSRHADGTHMAQFPLTFQPFLPYEVLSNLFSVTIGHESEKAPDFSDTPKQGNENGVDPNQIIDNGSDGTFGFKIRLDEDGEPITRVFISDRLRFPLSINHEVHGIACVQNTVGVQLVLEQIIPDDKKCVPNDKECVPDVNEVLEYPTQAQFASSPHLIASNGEYWCASYDVNYNASPHSPISRFGPFEPVNSMSSAEEKPKQKDVFLRLSVAIRSNSKGEPTSSSEDAQNKKKILGFTSNSKVKQKGTTKDDLMHNIRPADHVEILFFPGKPIADIQKFFQKLPESSASEPRSGPIIRYFPKSKSRGSSGDSKMSSSSSYLIELDEEKKKKQSTKPTKLIWAGLVSIHAVDSKVKRVESEKGISQASIHEIDPRLLPMR